jgi:DNA-binding response OmpR family regulator
MQASEKNILVVEDDRKTASLVALYLEKEGFRVLTAHDGKKALRLADEHTLSFVILDLMLPEVDGWEVCRMLRRRSDVPILMLTAREDEVDRISGLTMGADDYVVKPFSPRELVARVKAILRRGPMKTRDQETVLSTGDGLVLDTERIRVTLHDKTVQLTPHEYKLLQALMSRRGRVLTRGDLLDTLYPNDEAIVIDRVVDVHIGKLRQKIEKNPTKPRYILTVRGIGYRFSEDGER